MRNWRLHLSNIIPMPFSTEIDLGTHVTRIRWTQWRGKILTCESETL